MVGQGMWSNPTCRRRIRLVCCTDEDAQPSSICEGGRLCRTSAVSPEMTINVISAIPSAQAFINYRSGQFWMGVREAVISVCAGRPSRGAWQ